MSNDNIQTGLGLDCYNTDALTSPTKTVSQFVTKIPTADSPLIVKFIPDLLDPALKATGKLNSYFGFKEHQHCVGINTKTNKPMLYTHTCLKSLGHKFCPECDAYYEMYPKFKLAGEGTPEGKKLKALIDLFQPREKAWVYFVTPDSNTVKALRLPKDLVNKLWGKPKTKFRDAVPSLIEDMRKDGMNPYDLKSPVGWLKLYKTGEGFGTTYFAEVASREETEIVNGRPMGKRTRFLEANVSEYILTSYPRSELPDFRKFQFANAFSPEESEAFAKTGATPERIMLERQASASAANDHDEAGDQPATPDVGMANLGMTAAAPAKPVNTADEADKYL